MRTSLRTRMNHSRKTARVLSCCAVFPATVQKTWMSVSTCHLEMNLSMIRAAAHLWLPSCKSNDIGTFKKCWAKRNENPNPFMSLPTVNTVINIWFCSLRADVSAPLWPRLKHIYIYKKPFLYYFKLSVEDQSILCSS